MGQCLSGGLMYRWCRPFLFMLPPEVAHAVTLKALKWLPQVCFGSPLKETQPIQAMGLTFPHRVGLAAGLDKDGRYVEGLRKLSFAFIEVGTVTPLPQPGNEKPRLFRLPEARALINRMGFNNRGVVEMVKSLSLQRGNGIVGINIGKNKQTSLDNAIHDYRFCLEQVYAQADYITVNLSSPNTADLRLLQQEAYMSDLLAGLVKTQHQLAEQHARWVPMVVKCSPDESDDTLKRFAEIALKFGIQGIIATNTTIHRPGLKPMGLTQEAGGLSGRPVFAAATHALRVLKAAVGEQITLIAAGGIEDETTAAQKIRAGATLLQVYTGLIYEGPGLVRRLAYK